MLTKKKKILLEEEAILILSFLILLVLVIIFRPTITGYVIYESASPYVFSFTNPSDYAYDSNLINLTNSQVKLSQQTTQTTTTQTNYHVSSITSAIYDSQDRTSKLQNLDNEKLNVDKNKILDVTFNHELDNGDVITIYLEDAQNSDIYLCTASTQCSSPGYGLINYPGTAAYYNITISNLQSPTSTFNIDPPANESENTAEEDLQTETEETMQIQSTNIKFNHIYATYAETTETTTTTSSYPSSATLETQDLEILNLNKWDILSINENLNSQQINYYYSTDSGITYAQVPEDKNLSVFSSAKKIRIKVELISDTALTPILNQISLAFSLSQQDSSQNQTQPQTYYKTITNNNLNTTLTIASSIDITNSNLALSKESSLPSISNLTPVKKIALNPDSLISNNLLWLTLKIYYNETELTNLDESTLKLYYYNETQAAWQELNPIIDTAENYFLINLTHFSTYGIFGQALSTETPSLPGNSGSSGGGGGGSGGDSGSSGGTAKKGATTATSSTQQETKTEPSSTQTPSSGSSSSTQEKTVPLKISTGQATRIPDKILDFSKKNFGILIALSLIVITYIVVRIEKNIKRKKQDKLI